MIVTIKVVLCILLLALLASVNSFRGSLKYSRTLMKLRYNHNPFRQYDKETAKRVFNHTSPTPGSPVVYLKVEKDNLVYIKLIVSKEVTSQAFNESCSKFKKVKSCMKGFCFDFTFTLRSWKMWI